ncbi:MAG: hypothetical protein ACI3VD_06825 [Candidatus Limivicinus sp.]
MKRIMIVLFTLCLLLSACGKAPVEPVGAVEPSATESPAEPTPSPAAREQRKLEEGEEWLRENYIHWGKFYAKKEDYDAFLALPQEEAAVFTAKYFFKEGEAGKRCNELSGQYELLHMELEEIEQAAREGRQIQGYTYGADTSAWEYSNPNVEKSALPLEYFQLADQLQDIGSQITPELQAQRDEERNQFVLELAQLLAEQGLKTEVWATKTVEDYEEKQHYICFLTATPAQLWELETLTDISPVFIEPQYESVRLRFDIPIWTSEET